MIAETIRAARPDVRNVTVDLGTTNGPIRKPTAA
jgi:hypothetical protein